MSSNDGDDDERGDDDNTDDEDDLDDDDDLQDVVLYQFINPPEDEGELSNSL